MSDNVKNRLLLPKNETCRENAPTEGIISCIREDVFPHRQEKAELHDENANDGKPGEEGNFRGLAALILLWDLWETGESRLAIKDIAPSSPTLSVLFARYMPGKNKAHMVCIESEAEAFPLGILDEENLVIPGKSRCDISHLLPEECLWYDKSTRSFLYPEKYLSPMMRSALAERLNLFSGKRTAAFARSLMKYNDVIRESWSDNDFACRWTAARILSRLPVFSSHITCAPEKMSLPSSCVLKSFGKDERLSHLQPSSQLTWSFDGVPFAWEDDSLCLVPTPGEKQQEILLSIRENIVVLSKYMADWHQIKAEKAANELENKKLDDLVVKILSAADGAKEREKMQMTEFYQDSMDEGSLAYSCLLEMYFGSAGSSLLHCFSDVVLLLPEGCSTQILPFMSFRCGKDTVLPPVSHDVDCEIAKGTVAMTYFTSVRLPDGGMSVAVTMTGKQMAIFRKTFTSDCVISIAPSALKSVELFPAVNLPRWKNYCIFQNDESDLLLMPVDFSRDDKRICARQDHTLIQYADHFPSVLPAFFKGKSAGAFVLMVQPFSVADCGSAVVAVDFGQTGSSAAVSIGGKVTPLVSPSLAAPIIVGNDLMQLQEKTVPMQPVSAIRSSAFLNMEGDREKSNNPTRIFDKGCAFVPKSASHVASADSSRLCCGSVFLSQSENAMDFLLQFMTEAALQACIMGATNISWIFSEPACTSHSSLDACRNLIQQSAMAVAGRTGLPLTQGKEKCRFVSSTEALLQTASRECGKDDVAALSIGGGEITVGVKMSGMTRPVACASIPWGMQSAMLVALFQSPHLLTEDFCHINSDKLKENLTELEKAASRMDESQEMTDKCGMMADVTLGQYMGELQQYMNVCHLSASPALLRCQMLLVFALGMTLAGMAIEKVWQDDVLKSYLPRQLPLYVAGRGAAMILGLSDDERNQLVRFLQVGMSPNITAKNMTVTMSSMPKMETSLGSFTCPASQERSYSAKVSASDIVLRRFLITFFSAYPQESQRLFSDIMCPDIYGNPGIASNDIFMRTVATYFPKGIADADSFADAVFHLVNMR